MLRHIITSVFIFLTFTSLLIAQNYTLVWSDEFLGSSINVENWTHEIGGSGWGNNELQYYTNRADNSYIEDGKLVIRALEETYAGSNYTSARMITKGKQFFKYGKIEARMKLPYGQGLWPAFWMLGENIGNVGWPACGEIDIMEMIGGSNRENTTHGTIHWESNGHTSNGASKTLATGTFADDYHVFSIEWTPQKIEWFLDGISFHTASITPAALSEFHENFFIIFNVAIGGNWPGSPNSSTIFPQKMYVDYVRVYKNTEANPEVSIIYPPNNSVFNANENIILSADVQFQGDIQCVDFYQGSQRIGTTDLSPYSITWNNLSAGCYTITAKVITVDGYEGLSQNINIRVGDSCVEAPYSGSPVLIPGSIEVENFNIGGPNTAFYDTDLQNQGGAYRLSDHVDIEECSDAGDGYNVGWTDAGEWMKYFIEVEESSDYIISGRVASENSIGAFRVEVNGDNKTGTISVPNTGGWQNWSTVSSNAVYLEAGVYTIRVFIESGLFNLNRIDIYPLNALPKINIIFPSGGETLGVGTIQEIKWRSILVDDLSIGLSTDNGLSWEFVTQKTTSEFGIYRWLVPNVVSNECLIMLIDKTNSTIRDTSELLFSIENVNSVNETANLNLEFNLEQNYPNPFNPSTSISYSIPKNSLVSLKIFDVLGNIVDVVVNEIRPAGSYTVIYNAQNLASGVYYYRLDTGSNFDVKKLILLK